MSRPCHLHSQRKTRRSASRSETVAMQQERSLVRDALLQLRNRRLPQHSQRLSTQPGTKRKRKVKLDLGVGLESVGEFEVRGQVKLHAALLRLGRQPCSNTSRTDPQPWPSATASDSMHLARAS